MTEIFKNKEPLQHLKKLAVNCNYSSQIKYRTKIDLWDHWSTWTSCPDQIKMKCKVITSCCILIPPVAHSQVIYSSHQQPSHNPLNVLRPHGWCFTGWTQRPAQCSCPGTKAWDPLVELWPLVMGLYGERGCYAAVLHSGKLAGSYPDTDRCFLQSTSTFSSSSTLSQSDAVALVT